MPAFALVHEVNPAFDAGGPLGLLGFCEMVLRGISQLFLVDNVLSGLVILVGFAIASRLLALMAVLGAVVGTAIGLLVGAEGFAISHGLWGYNAYITAVAIGGVFYVFDAKSLLLGLVGAVGASFLYGGMAVVFGSWGVPTLTLPFCFVTLAFFLLRRSSALLQPVPLEEITTPEGIRRTLRRHVPEDEALAARRHPPQ